MASLSRTIALLSTSVLLTLPIFNGMADAAVVSPHAAETASYRPADTQTSAETHVAGTLTALTSTQATINGQTYTLASNVGFQFHDHHLTPAEVPLNVTAEATLNAAGQVTKIVLQSDPNLPPGESVTGTISSVTASTIQIGSYTLTLASSVTVKFHDHQVTTAEIPAGVEAKASLNAAGQVTKIVLQSDPNLPSGESVTGTIGSVTTSTIKIGSYTLTLAPSVTVKFHDHQLTTAEIPTGVEAKASLNAAGQVTKIELKSDPSLPSGESVTGTIGSVTTSTIKIGSYTLTLASSVTVQYHDYHLTLTQVPTGATAKVVLNGSGQVTKIKLTSDPAIPPSSSFVGTISGISATTLQIGTYSLSLASQVKVQYGPYDQLTLADVPTTVTAQVHINNRLQVTKIRLESDPALPSSNTLTGALSAISPTSLTIDGYTLPIDANVEIPTYQGQVFTVGQLQNGWTVKIKINSQGVVRKIDIQSGPTVTTTSSN